MIRWWWRLAARGLPLVAVLGLALPAAATTSSPARIPVLQLAGHTVIRWHGTVAVRIYTPKDVRFPDDHSVRLFSRGHFAFIRIDPTSLCEFDVPHCGTGMIDWTPAISASFGKGYTATHGAGTDIFYAIQDPEGLSKGWSVFYLASDGESTLEFSTPDLAGRRDVRVTYPAPITVQRLPIACNSAAAAACDSHSGYASRLKFGGATHDVGTSGLAQAIVLNEEGVDQTTTAEGVPRPQPLGVVGCIYGPGMTVSQDPSAAAHPTGCDIAPKSPHDADAIEAVEFSDTTLNPTPTGNGFWRGDAHRHGATYLGYIIDSPVNLPPPQWQEAWGIWITYLTP